ncbi:hypothetical protein GOP47_0015965 [Adiantum capillus-veneris]|uniref:Uncharacterized protein n=1 Tax=Adiantum capillus-veneris TaxID=13818 RepID=A0A9D4UKP0_ADICA|nr:hypothetical protein GOP47_0015965 [Adiantum capillus-veneris]
MAPTSEEEVDEARQALVRHFRSSDEERAFDKQEQIEVFSEETPPFSWKKLWLFTGPGFLMSIAYLDPGNLESDLQSGAMAGYSLLWLLMWATVMGLILQLLSARLGVATGCDLAELCREEYPFWARIVLWLMTEVAIIGADIQEVIGSAIALRILSLGYIPLWAGVLITGIDGFIFLFLENYGIRKLEALFGVLISIMAVSFAWMFAQAKPSAGELFTGLLIPRIPSGTTSQAVAVVGALIMPHNIFLHSALVQSRAIDITSSSHVKEALRYFSIESAFAIFISFIINVFVVSVFAKAFFGTDVAESIGLANAGEYLQAQYGGGFFPILYIWAVGLLAAGQSSTMTGTYAGQFVMAGFLNLRVKKWVRAVITRTVAILPTVIIALIFDGSEQRLDLLNEWLNVLQSVQLPFALIPLLCIVSKEQVMGVFKVRPVIKVLSWLITLLVLVINGYLLVEFCSTYIVATTTVTTILGVLAALYVMFVIYLVIQAWYGNRVVKPFKSNTLQ